MIATLTVGEQIVMAIVAVAAVLGLAVLGIKRAKHTRQPGETE
ncbi:hypothetical protein ACIQRK_37385 [Streptomyces anulatus]|nr:hypothetical protein [Streptomyces sp. VB1]UZI29659.1 hypothetical protein OH133_16820 [Streptomyces sp. VB1]